MAIYLLVINGGLTVNKNKHQANVSKTNQKVEKTP